MNFKYSIPVVAVAAFFLLFMTQVHAGLNDMLKGVQDTLTKTSSVGQASVPESLSEDKIIQGLKEALEIGSNNVVDIVSKADGYYKNPEIKIPLPEHIKKTEQILRSVGLGSTVDAFETSMNRAAEAAAPQARDLLVDTIKGMSITDAKTILNGRENEATLYFKDKTEDKLRDVFKPIVNSSMASVGVTRYYQDLSAQLKTIPFAGTVNLDLDQYVTDRALGGLYTMLEKEEKMIREDPTARVTDLLKDVFGR